MKCCKKKILYSKWYYEMYEISKRFVGEVKIDGTSVKTCPDLQYEVGFCGRSFKTWPDLQTADIDFLVYNIFVI